MELCNTGFLKLKDGVLDQGEIPLSLNCAVLDFLVFFFNSRLAIARAVYQNSSILIFDEATSALDSRSEQLVRHAVQRLMEDRTVRMID